ncbi:hypothetical protein GCM10010358_28740 [Streptomyces minutiscleroticus]|uniref:Uncharacterized protein n=1 Tax=Streptomyces minutiscleroticus TaxID=68238 RepID=A0A918KTB8_9ACTN|nr:hypothetical protein GCM10010358_28740 [Streptomyces minutiscleroticus]
MVGSSPAKLSLLLALTGRAPNTKREHRSLLSHSQRGSGTPNAQHEQLGTAAVTLLNSQQDAS